ncbi:MAG: N-acetylmuramoyl-L-alanine amidase [Proteobacteria bacterium]|nr:N-acetylmuramoyl-L-alanine amidase [Pseudomonadota bacterium]
MGRLLPLVALFVAGLSHAAEIAIDIGHTRAKPGALSASGVWEFDFNRTFVRALELQLASVGVGSHVINDSGKVGSLSGRTTLARKDRFFVSIHHDSVKQRYRPVKDPRFKGYSLWVSERNADYEGSVRCARLIADELLKARFQPSHYHSDAVYGENRPVVDWDRGIFSNNQLAVLAAARGPAILVEVGVIANPAEETVLSDPAMTEARARTIATGLQHCLAG